MAKSSYLNRREQLELYFDRTASKAWEQLTSEAPVSRVRQSVRAGRNTMREQLLSWLPDKLEGKRILDAGCGTGSVAIEMAERGAHVTAVDISGSLIEVARSRTPSDLVEQIDYQVGDMIFSREPGFDYVLAMDSLIHYPEQDMVTAIASLLDSLANEQGTVLFTFAPRTPVLMLIKRLGLLFPRSDRSPAIEPIAEDRLRSAILANQQREGVTIGRTHRVNTTFYKSQAMELKLQ